MIIFSPRKIPMFFLRSILSMIASNTLTIKSSWMQIKILFLFFTRKKNLLNEVLIKIWILLHKYEWISVIKLIRFHNKNSKISPFEIHNDTFGVTSLYFPHRIFDFVPITDYPVFKDIRKQATEPREFNEVSVRTAFTAVGRRLICWFFVRLKGNARRRISEFWRL